MMKFYKSSMVLPIFLFVFCNLSISFAQLNSTQLKIVPIDSTVPCKRVLFEGSVLYKNTFFMLPPIAPGSGKVGVKNYLIGKKVDNHYTLEINYYFPSEESKTYRSSAILAKPEDNYCNIDSLKIFLAQTRSISNPSDVIIATLPITKIAVSIEGLNDIAYIEGRLKEDNTVKIFDYENKMVTARFKITEKEKEYFQEKLISQAGIESKVEFYFQASAEAGFIQARVSSENIIQSLNAEFSGRPAMKISKLQFKAFLAKNLNSSNVQIVSQGIDDQSKLSQIITQLSEKIINSINFEKPNPNMAQQNKSDTSNETISLDLAVNYLKSNSEFNLTMTVMKSAESASAFRLITLSSPLLNDPNLLEIKLNASSPSPLLGVEVKLKDKIVITFNGWYDEVVDYSHFKTRYLTVSDINALQLHEKFPVLMQQNSKLSNVNINGIHTAQLELSMSTIERFFLERLAGNLNVKNTSGIYRWKMHELTSRLIKVKSKLFDKMSIDEVKKYNISLSFSGLGNSKTIKLSDVLNSNEFLTGTFNSETNQIILEAKQNLGLLRFRASFSGPEFIQNASGPMALKTIEQVRLNQSQEVIDRQYHHMESDQNPVVMQKTIVLSVARP